MEITKKLLFCKCIEWLVPDNCIDNTIVLKAGLHEVLPMILLHCHLTLFDSSAKKNVLKLIQTERTLCSRKAASWRLGLQC